MLYKVRHDQVAVSELKAKLLPPPPRQRRGHSQQYSLPHTRTLYHQNSFLPKTIKDWNALPQAAVDAGTLDTFVSRVSHLPQ